MELMDFLNMNVDPAPKYKLQDTVWVISNRQVKDANVLAVNYKLCLGKGDKPVLMLVGYDLNLYKLETGLLEYHSRELYATKEEADQDAVWHPVAFSEQEWDAAIGNRDKLDALIAGAMSRENEADDDDDDDDADEDEDHICELTSCCANISEIRDILLACKADGGMLERDRKDLQIRITRDLPGHYEASTQPILNRILASLNIARPPEDADRASGAH